MAASGASPASTGASSSSIRRFGTTGSIASSGGERRLIKLSSASSSEIYYSAESDLNDDADNDDADEFQSGESIPLLSGSLIGSAVAMTTAASNTDTVRSAPSGGGMRRSSTRRLEFDFEPHIMAESSRSLQQRPITLKITSKEHAKPRTPKLRRLPHQRAHSVDMLGGSGPYENGCVDDLADSYKSLLTVSRLRRPPRGKSAAQAREAVLPRFDVVRSGVYVPGAVRQKRGAHLENGVQDKHRGLVQKARLLVKIQVR